MSFCTAPLPCDMVVGSECSWLCDGLGRALAWNAQVATLNAGLPQLAEQSTPARSVAGSDQKPAAAPRRPVQRKQNGSSAPRQRRHDGRFRARGAGAQRQIRAGTASGGRSCSSRARAAGGRHSAARCSRGGGGRRCRCSRRPGGSCGSRHRDGGRNGGPAQLPARHQSPALCARLFQQHDGLTAACSNGAEGSSRRWRRRGAAAGRRRRAGGGRGGGGRTRVRPCCSI